MLDALQLHLQLGRCIAVSAVCALCKSQLKVSSAGCSAQGGCRRELTLCSLQAPQELPSLKLTRSLECLQCTAPYVAGCCNLSQACNEIAHYLVHSLQPLLLLFQQHLLPAAVIQSQAGSFLSSLVAEVSLPDCLCSVICHVGRTVSFPEKQPKCRCFGPRMHYVTPRSLKPVKSPRHVEHPP